MIDPKATYLSATRHARGARKSAGRLLLSGLGFSAAYFLDPQQGTARRTQARAFLARARHKIATARVHQRRPIGATAPLASTPGAGRPATNGVRATTLL